MPIISERFKSAWNAFLGRDPTRFDDYSWGFSYGMRPDRVSLTATSFRSIVSSIYNQIAVDCSQINIRHVRLNDEGKFEAIIDDSLNQALSLEANIDQSGRELIRDAVISLLDEGCVAIVPVLTDVDPYFTDSYKIYELRVGKIVDWMPRSVRVEVYNDMIGQKQQIVLDKRLVAIINNPFYEIMNEPNSTAKRLMRVLSQLDRTNEQNSSGKLDLIIQLPYTIRSEAKRRQAEERRKDLEKQLTGSVYGIGYTDGSERIIQLNRGVENNLWNQAKELTQELFNQMGLSTSIFDGTADEKTTLNYQNRTLEPILSAITENMERKWISKTARSQKQAIRFFKDPFKLVPVGEIAEMADKFTRNEIMTSNELRAVMGMRPAKDPKADQLINSNLNQPESEKTPTEEIKETVKIQNESKEET